MVFNLSNTDINSVSDEINVFLSEYKVEKRNQLRARLMMEEILLSYQEKLGESTEITLTKEHRFIRDVLAINIPGEKFDPFTKTDKETVLHRLLTYMGMDPVWRYKHGCNCIVINLWKKRQISTPALIVFSIVMGFVLGFVAQHLSESSLKTVADTILQPISDTIMSFLSGVAIFLIFFSVIQGLCGMGDMRTFKRVGKKLLENFLLTPVLYLLVSYIVLLPFFSVVSEGSAVFDGKAVYTMLLDIIPGNNIIQSFTDGNTIQVVFLAVCIGMALLTLSSQYNGIQDGVSRVTDLLQCIVKFIIGFLPVVVFIGVFRLVAFRQYSIISKVYIYPLSVILIDIVIIIIGVLRVSLTKKVNPVRLLKKLLPTMIIAFSTSSSVAAFTCDIETCKDELGIEKDLVDVGIPLGQIIFMPADMTVFLCVALCMGKLYGTPITVQWLVILAVFAFISSIATAPLPGAVLSCCVLLFSQLGIPAGAITIIIAFDVLVDRITTVANLAVLQTEMIQVAGSLDMLDKNILRGT